MGYAHSKIAVEGGNGGNICRQQQSNQKKKSKTKYFGYFKTAKGRDL